MAISLIKRGDLLGRLVIDQQTDEELGIITQLLVDVKTHQVVQVKCTSGFLGPIISYFRWTDIESIEPDSILVNASNISTFSALLQSASTMVCLELWTGSENKVGIISDYYFVPETGKITDYTFVSSTRPNITKGSYCLPCNAIVSVGSKRVIAKDEALQSAKQFLDGLQNKVNQIVELLETEYAQTKVKMPSNMTSLLEGAKTQKSVLQESGQKVLVKAKQAVNNSQKHLKILADKEAEQGQVKVIVVEKAGEISAFDRLLITEQKTIEPLAITKV